MTITPGKLAAREHLPEVGVEKGARELLQGRPHTPARVLVTGQEAAFETSVAFQDLARGHAEGDEVGWSVEPVAEVLEEMTVAIGLELPDEAGRGRAHGGEHLLEGPREELDASVGEARCQKGHDLPVPGIGVTEGKPDGVVLDSRAIVEAPIEALERLP
jgi:hypothetical protein